MTSDIYTTPPLWFVNSKNGKDATMVLEPRGWVAHYPNGRQELIVSMKGIPEEYLTGHKPTKKEEPVKEPEATEEEVKDTPEPAKPKGRNTKGRNTEGRSTEGRSTESRSTESRSKKSE